MSDDPGARKKRVSARQLTDRDDVDDEVGETEAGTFKEADPSVISQRRIVSARRNNRPTDAETPKPAINWSFTPAVPATPAATPAPAASSPSPNKAESSKETTAPASPAKESTGAASSPSKAKDATTPTKEGGNGTEAKATTPTPALSGFAAFTANPTFPTFPAFPSFSFSQPNPFAGSGASIFGQNIAPPKPKEGSDDEGEDPTIPEPEPQGPPTVLKEVPVVTGEEDETTLHSVRAKLYAMEENKFKERGVGQLKINKNKEGKVRLIMRDQGGKHLRLNVAMFPEMRFDRAADTSIRFVAFSEGARTIFLLRVSRKDEANELISALEANKGTPPSSSSSSSPSPSPAASPAKSDSKPAAAAATEEKASS